MARRATVINGVRASASEPVLLLDAGGTLLGQALADATDGAVIVAAMNAMGYDALTVGQAELQQGLDTLRKRALEASFPILSCNLVIGQDDQPIFDPYAVVLRGGIRFGIIGVSEADMGWLDSLTEVRILDPLASVRRILPEVRAQSDVVILLSHLGLEGDKSLAQAEPRIDIIVGGRTRQILDEPVLVGGTVIVQAGYDGEWLGRLDVALDEQHRISQPLVEIVTLWPEVADDPAMTTLADSYKQRFLSQTPAN